MFQDHKDRIPQIFNESIINSAVEDFWDNNKVSALPQTELLILSNPYEKGSEEEEQLMKILKACNLEQEAYQTLILKPEEQLSWNLLKTQTKASKIILFGVVPKQLAISALFILHEVNKFDNALWMPIINLKALCANIELKKHLWNNVFKKVFLEM